MSASSTVRVSNPIVLCYHAVSDSWSAPLSVTPREFGRQIRLLLARGYRGETFTQAVLGPRDARTVAITFDDAFRSVFELAFPILSRAGFRATVFVPSAFPDREAPMAWPGIDHWLGGPHEPELRPMSWEQLHRLADAGWEIGSHTRTHPRLTQLDDGSVAEELAGSRRDCEQGLDRPCRSLAYPYGDHDGRIVQAAREAGYAAACGLPAGRHRPDPLCWPRIGIYHPDHRVRFRLKVSPAVRRLHASRAWALLSTLRPATRDGPVGRTS
jgi:peptidoglycan/xylan/chitin deacetylase (PgdA/CDA1 family)